MKTPLRIALAVSMSAVTTLVAWKFALRTLIELPHDALIRPKPDHFSLRHNAFGLALITLGVLLLVMPGPGILLIVVGLASTEFPGRAHILKRLLARPRLLDEVNALRARHGKPKLISSTP